MKIGQKYFAVMKASLIYLEMMEKNNVKRRIDKILSAKCTKSQDTRPLVRVNAQIYKKIVQDHVVPIIQNSGFDRATFMHKAKVVMSYLSEQDFEIIDWPLQSPDLNPIENLWKTLEVKFLERNPTKTEDLRLKLQEE